MNEPNDRRPPSDRGSFEERWQQRFQEFAQNRDDDAGIAGWSPSGLEARLRHFASVWSGSPAGTWWLDAGCGAGTYSRHLSGRQINVIGIDYSLPTVRKAKLRCPAKVLMCVGDVTCLPVRSEFFDGALCFGVIQALSDSNRAVHELSETVRIGGQIWIDALNYWSLPSLWDRLRRKMSGRPRHMRYETAQNLKRIMEKHGIGAVQIYWLPILPTKWQRYQWILETRIAKFLFHRIPLLGPLLSHAFVISGTKKRPQ